MGYTLERFCTDAAAALSQDPGPAGREVVARRLESLLVDADFVAAHLGPDKPSGAETLYVDPEHGFRVMAHTNAVRPTTRRTATGRPGRSTAWR